MSPRTERAGGAPEPASTPPTRRERATDPSPPKVRGLKRTLQGESTADFNHIIELLHSEASPICDGNSDRAKQFRAALERARDVTIGPAIPAEPLPAGGFGVSTVQLLNLLVKMPAQASLAAPRTLPMPALHPRRARSTKRAVPTPQVEGKRAARAVGARSGVHPCPGDMNE